MTQDDIYGRKVTEDIATLRANVGHLTQQIADMHTIQKLQNEKLDAVLIQMSEARGGWKTLLWLGGAGTALGTGMTWLIDYIAKAPK